MMYVLYRESDGTAVSSGSVLASPLPDGVKAVEVVDADADGLRIGRKTWDAATRAVVDAPPEQVVLSAEDKLDIVKAKLAQLSALSAPVLAADVADILAEIQGAI